LFTGNAFGVFVYPVLAVVLVVALVRGHHDRPRIICMGIFAVYVVEALKEILFPIPIDGSMAQQFTSVPFWTFTNFIPIRGLLSGAADRGEIIRNILVAMPFGFGAWFVAHRPTVRKVAIAGIAASLLVETLQAIIGATIGFMYRVVDVNDVILNTLGILLGIVLFMAFAKVFRSIDARRGEPEGRYWSFLRAVTTGPALIS
jgi:glycopeptide antibiotics resistance protein